MRDSWWKRRKAGYRVTSDMASIGDSVTATIVEPGPGAGGYHQPKRESLPGARPRKERWGSVPRRKAPPDAAGGIVAGEHAIAVGVFIQQALLDQ